MDVAENTPTNQKAAIFKALFPPKNKKRENEKMKSYPHLISSILIGHHLPTSSSAAAYCIILHKKKKKKPNPELNISLLKQTSPPNKETEFIGKN